MASVNKIRLASELTFDSIVDGPGLRIVVWTQGCPHHCKGCHNMQTWDHQSGKLFHVDEIIKQIKNSNLQDGITLSGGEPFEQSEALIPIVETAIAKGLNVWAYSGYLFEQLSENEKQSQLLALVDVLVDGKFKVDEKDYRLWYKGSSNQRIIDVRRSLRERKIILSDWEAKNQAIQSEVS